MVYDFSRLMRRGKGVAMAQLINVVGFAGHRLLTSFPGVIAKTFGRLLTSPATALAYAVTLCTSASTG